MLEFRLRANSAIDTEGARNARPTLPMLACALALTIGEPAFAISAIEDALKTIEATKSTTITPTRRPPPASVRPTSSSQSAAIPLHTSADLGPDRNGPPVVAPIGSVPSVVLISASKSLEDGYLCAGVLISSRWVLTVAHCVFDAARRWPNGTDPYIFFGTQDIANPGAKFVAKAIVMHPQFDAKSQRNNLALLKFDSGNENVGLPLRISGPSAQSQVGEIGSIFGYGASTADSHNGVLQLIQSNVVDDGVCFSAVNYPGLQNTGIFCGSSLLKYRDICHGFEGAAVIMIDNGGQQYLAGLASTSAECSGEIGKPNAFIDVQYFLPWIKSVLSDNASN